MRRGRRRCQSATTILHSCSQLSRKSSVCKFPSLTFKTRSRDQTCQPRSKHKKKATESTVGSDTGNQAQEVCQTRTISCAQCSDTPKRQTTSIRTRKVKRHSDGASSFTRSVNQPETPTAQVEERCRFLANGASTPASNELSNTEVSSIGPPPDVDTPKVIQEESSDPSPAGLHLLMPQSCTLLCSQPPEILVTDTPERDYGLKVTWRRRKSQMLLLKERGHLSESDVLIRSSC